jgi:uncharacterized protein (DUF58 family)
MVPSMRLLIWVAIAGLAAALLAVNGGGGTLAGFAIAASLVALVAGDGLGALGRLDGLAVSIPAVSRMQKDRESEIELVLKDDRRRRLDLRLAIELKASFANAVETLAIELPPSAAARVRWRCTPSARGRYPIGRCRVETASPLGFWHRRAIRTLSGEVRVFPDLMRERRNVAALFLNRGRAGIHAQRFAGKGREFEKLREYLPGDGPEDIHWRATAKRGQPMTKVFQVERTQEVYVIIDSSRLSARAAGEGDGPALERYLTSALILGIAAEQQGDHFGLMTFSDRVDRFLRARSGRAHFNACREASYTLEPKIVAPAFEDAAAFLRARVRKRSLLVFLTALDDPALAERFARSIELICGQHLIIVNTLQSREVAPLFAGETVGATADIYARLAGHLQWHELRELGRGLMRRGVALHQTGAERLAAAVVSQYLAVKAHQLL